MTVICTPPKDTINVREGKGKVTHLKKGEPVPERLAKRAMKEGWGTESSKKTKPPKTPQE